jgi:hypothetical protein
MANIHFACIAQDTDTKVNLLVLDGGKIVGRQEGLHDHAEAERWVKEKYDMDLTVGDCYANYNAFRASRYGKR